MAIISGAGGSASPLTTKGDLFGYSNTNVRIPVGANGTVLVADSTATPGVAWTPRESYACIIDQKAVNTDGGGFTSGAARTRDLNTEQSDPDGIVTISANQFTLLIGTYRIDASAPALGVTNHKAWLQNITDGTVTLIGTSEYSDNTLPSQTRSVIQGRFTIAGTKVFEIQHQCAVTKATNGLGIKANMTIAEVYTVVEIIKE